MGYKIKGIMGLLVTILVIGCLTFGLAGFFIGYYVGNNKDNTTIIKK